MDSRVSVNENAFGGEALSAMTGDGIAVVEVSMSAGVELDQAVVVEAGREVAIGTDRLDRSHVAIRNAEQFVRDSKLDAVSYRELAFDLFVDGDAGEAAGIVGRKLSVRPLDRDLVCRGIDRYDRRVGGGFDADRFAATCVTNYIVDLVVACPGSLGSGHILTLNQNTESMIFGGKASSGLQ